MSGSLRAVKCSSPGGRAWGAARCSTAATLWASAAGPARKADLGRHLVYHPGAGVLTRVRYALTLDGSWAMAVYRFGRRLKTVPMSPSVIPLLWVLYAIAEVILGVLTSISIDLDAHI